MKRLLFIATGLKIWDSGKYWIYDDFSAHIFPTTNLRLPNGHLGFCMTSWTPLTKSSTQKTFGRSDVTGRTMVFSEIRLVTPPGKLT